MKQFLKNKQFKNQFIFISRLVWFLLIMVVIWLWIYYPIVLEFAYLQIFKVISSFTIFIEDMLSYFFSNKIEVIDNRLIKETNKKYCPFYIIHAYDSPYRLQYGTNKHFFFGPLLNHLELVELLDYRKQLLFRFLQLVEEYEFLCSFCIMESSKRIIELEKIAFSTNKQIFDLTLLNVYPNADLSEFYFKNISQIPNFKVIWIRQPSNSFILKSYEYFPEIKDKLNFDINEWQAYCSDYYKAVNIARQEELLNLLFEIDSALKEIRV